MKDFRVLIVDDNRDLADNLAELLQQEGCSTTVVYTGEDAVAHALVESYDLAVLDIKLPGINGFEVLQAIRRLRPEMTGIMMTAHEAIGVYKDMISHDDITVLRKPFQMEDLSNRIAVARREKTELLPAMSA